MREGLPWMTLEEYFYITWPVLFVSYFLEVAFYDAFSYNLRADVSPSLSICDSLTPRFFIISTYWYVLSLQNFDIFLIFLRSLMSPSSTFLTISLYRGVFKWLDKFENFN